ncbi:MAG TPA: hypothetical protein VFH31_01605 [Pyrinomonadaceae bacterium]|nr:hypothetical protein [Pyrinomonadaceae bacterium]
MIDTNAAIGLKAKTGRAIAVVLSGPINAPQLVSRSELNLTDPHVPATFQPYHEVMELPWDESLKNVKPFVRAIEKVSTKALAGLIHELKAQGLMVIGVAVVGSQDRDLSKIGNYHIRAHAAEGMLFRQVLEHAAQSNKLPHRTFQEKTLGTQATTELRVTVAQLNNRLKSIGQSAGAPWRTDQRTAATAAWLVLRDNSRLN